MKQLMTIVAALFFFSGCSKSDEPLLNPSNDNEEDKSGQEVQTFNLMQESFREVQAYKDSLQEGCEGQHPMTDARHQHWDEKFHVAVSQFRHHHHEYHEEGHEGHHHDGHQHEEDNDEQGEGHHHEDSHNQDEEHHEDHDDHDQHDSQADDHYDREEREMHDRVDEMEDGHCHYDS